jgi:hypothetical protein
MYMCMNVNMNLNMNMNMNMNMNIEKCLNAGTHFNTFWAPRDNKRRA